MPVRYHQGRFPPEDRLDWRKLVPLIGPATAAVARFDGVLGAIPNPGVLLAPLATQEAVLSSRIEGTQATMGEVLEFEAGREPDSAARRDDINEVLNYRSAIRQAEEMLKVVPLSLRVVRAAHATLMQGVRGEGKAPGEYRRIPNWIGPPGCTIENATFVPIDAAKLPAAMGAWESYIHTDAPDRLVQLAILHAEFEALHPFLDGNGRLGRMLVPLFLWQHGLIQAPMFYISAYFEARRNEYYDGLLAVSEGDDWTGWCGLFLQAVQAQAEENLARAQGVLGLYDGMKSRVVELTRSHHAIRVLDWIFERPIFRAADLIATADIPRTSAQRILNTLVEHGVLGVLREGHGRQARLLWFPELIGVAEGHPD